MHNKNINKQLLIPLAFMLLLLNACKTSDGNVKPIGPSCDFNSLTASSSEIYEFNTTFAGQFTQSTRWESYNADIKLVNEKGQLTAFSDNTSQALEAWKLFNKQMPYNQSWEISVDVHIEAYWNTNGGKNAQVGAGIFVGKPVASGQASKVYECNFAAINGDERFVQAQLVANRLGDDPIDVQFKSIDQSTEFLTLKIRFCSSDKTLSLYADDNLIGNGRAIDASGMDNWGLSASDKMDIGIMGFAEKTTITSNQPTLDNFRFTIY